MNFESSKLDWSQDGIAVLIGSGPSLTQSDVTYCYEKARVLVINDNWQLAPWADAMYCCDPKWWLHEDKKKAYTDFKQPKYRLARSPKNNDEKEMNEMFPEITAMKNTGTNGLETEWPGLRTGGNGGHQAINLAVHFGVKKIILLGYDMQETNGKKHWFGDHCEGLKSPNQFNLNDWIDNFNQLAPVLETIGVKVVNCSRETALTCFERADLRGVL